MKVFEVAQKVNATYFYEIEARSQQEAEALVEAELWRFEPISTDIEAVEEVLYVRPIFDFDPGD